MVEMNNMLAVKLFMLENKAGKKEANKMKSMIRRNYFIEKVRMKKIKRLSGSKAVRRGIDQIDLVTKCLSKTLSRHGIISLTARCMS